MPTGHFLTERVVTDGEDLIIEGDPLHLRGRTELSRHTLTDALLFEDLARFEQGPVSWKAGMVRFLRLAIEEGEMVENRWNP